MKIDILENESESKYIDLFNGCENGFIQQSLHWAEVISSLSNDVAIFIIASDESEKIVAGLPLYYLKRDIGSILTSLPHAGPLGGVLIRQDVSEFDKTECYRNLLEKSINLAKELNCVSLTIITNPFTNDAEEYKNDRKPDYALINFCQAIDLERIFSINREYNSGKSEYNNKIRKNLKKAAESGITVGWMQDISDFEEWYKIHIKRHQELNALPLPKDLLENIVTKLNPVKKGGLALAKHNDKIVGGCIYVWHIKIVDAFIMSSDSDYMEYRINHALTDFALRWFRDKGMKWFNWQSCKRNSGVYDFKKRWGSMEKEYEFLTWVFDGFEKLFDISLESVAEEYRWHYVAPFEALKNRQSKGTFIKG